MLMSLKITGAREMEKVLLKLFPSVARKVGAQALRAGAKPIILEAKARVHKRSGELHDSIATEMDKKTDPNELKIWLGVKKPVSARFHFEEFGTRFQSAHPFFRPAMDAKFGESLNAMGKTLARGIEREAARMAKN